MKHDPRSNMYKPAVALPSRLESTVMVQLMEDPTRPPDSRRFIRVELYSHRTVMTGRLKSQTDIFPWECGSEREFERKIEAVAGAMAEEQCERYFDTHDPSEVARAAREAYAELKADMEVHQVPFKQE